MCDINMSHNNLFHAISVRYVFLHDMFLRDMFSCVTFILCVRDQVFAVFEHIIFTLYAVDLVSWSPAMMQMD